MENDDYFKLRDIFLTGMAMHLPDSDIDLLERLLKREQLGLFWFHCYEPLKAELKMKPEAYFEMVFQWVYLEIKGSLLPEDQERLNEHRQRYESVKELSHYAKLVFSEP